MGPSEPNFTLIGDGVGTVASEIQTFAKVALFWRHFLHSVTTAEYTDPAEIWCVIRDYRYTLAGHFSYNRRTVMGTGPLKHYKFCQNVGLLAGFPCQATEKKPIRTTFGVYRESAVLCQSRPWSPTGTHKPLNFTVW